jgi:hypothetical protein
MAAVTNADFLSLAASTPSEDLPQRFRSLGCSPERAARLARFLRWRRKAKFAIRPATFILVLAAAWIAWALTLAITASPSTPSQHDMLVPSIAAMVAGFVIAIVRAVTLTTGIEWEPMDRVPRELASTPRRAFVPHVPLASTIAASIAAILVGLAGFSVDDIRDAQWLQRYGTETTGQVVRRDVVHGGKSTRYTISYAYGNGPLHFQKRATVSRAEYDAMTEGAPVPVTYDPLHPLVSEPRPRNALRGRWRPLLPIAILGGTFAVILSALALMTRQVQRQNELLATRGVAALARVTKYSGGTVRYEFEGGEGRMAFGKRRPARLPVAGETFVVLRDPDNARRSVPLAALQDVRFV